MPTLTDYKPPQSDGTLPLDASANMFQYKRFVHWNTFLAYGAGLGKTGKGSWTVQIITPDQKVLFEQKVTIALTVIFTGFSMIWYYYDGGEKIETTIINGDAVTEDNPAWQHTIGGTDQSEFGTFLPGGGEVPYYPTTGGIIDANWQSPVYLMDIPVGSKMHVVTDNWGIGSSARPEWRWRFSGGGAAQAFYFDNKTGMTWQGVVENGQTLVRNTRRMKSGVSAERQVSVLTKAARYMRLFRVNSGIYLLVDTEGLQLWASYDDGASWESAMQVQEEIKVLFATVAKDGGQFYVYGAATIDNGELWQQGDLLMALIARNGKKFITKNMIKIKTPNMPSKNITGLDYAKGALLLSVNDNGKIVLWQSVDEGEHWAPLDAS